MVRTRVAVSPTGYPHIGTIYQALFDYAYAKGRNGNFIVRIEDTDRERFVPDAEERLYSSLDWFGIVEDESSRKGGSYKPYVQSERLPLYRKFAEELIEKGHAYYCFCSRERLEDLRKKQQQEKKTMIYDKHCLKLSSEEIKKHLINNTPKVIRLKVQANKKIVTHDEIRGDIEFESNLVDDQVLLKSDGYPTYHLAVVVDDHAMQITDVVRAEEWIPSFPKHTLLYQFLNWQMPKFYHTSALRNPDHTKLSKRQGHTNISWYQEEGYLPEAILNYIALLGWTHPEEKETFSIEEFIEKFDLKDIKPIGPVFDLTKLSWMNGEYIRKMSDAELKERIVSFYKNDNVVQSFIEQNSKIIDAVISLAKTRMKTLKEFKDLIIPVSIQLSPEEKQIAQLLHNKFVDLGQWNTDIILVVIRDVIRTEKIKGGLLYKIMTGREHGLPLPEMLVLLGKEKVLDRLKSNE